MLDFMEEHKDYTIHPYDGMYLFFSLGSYTHSIS
jgi:hypothetical protein